MSYNRPLISVVVAVMNGEKSLQRCIDSVSRQSHTEKELIIIDGGSCDTTVDIIKKNIEHVKYWESKKDKGVYHAWNKALDHVNGEWICFLGADDFFWSEDCLHQMSHYLEKTSPKARIIYGRVNLVTENGKILYSIGQPWANLKGKFFQINCLPHPGLMHHRSIFEDYGKFDDSFVIAGDYELLLRELIHFNPHYVPVTMVGMQHGGLSTLEENSIIGLREMRVALRMHGIKIPGLYWILGFTKAFLKLSISRLAKR